MITEKTDIVIVILILMIGIGVLFDFFDFACRLIKYIKKQNVPSAVPIIGLLTSLAGLIGLKIKLFLTWLEFFILFIILLFLPVLFQIILPWLIEKYMTNKQKKGKLKE